MCEAGSVSSFSTQTQHPSTMRNMQCLAIGVLLLPIFCAGYLNNCTLATTKMKKCSLRYDLAVTIGKSLLKEMNCQEWLSKMYSICNDTLSILYHDVPPYMFTRSDGTVDGILPAMLDISLKACCSSCTRISYTPPFKTVEELSEHFFNQSHYTLLMPVLAVSNMASYFNKPYVKLMDTPGVVFVQMDQSANVIMQKTFSSFADTWPLLVITLLLTLQGGVLIWIFDRKENPNEFPASFLRGSIEGSWWAYISMTTVGYGDKAPRSLFGRLFAIFWITIGVSISGIFTASLSSSLTSAVVHEETKIDGLNVGVLKPTLLVYEDNIVYREGGTVTSFEDMESMMDALKRKEIDGILIDSFILQHNWEAFKEADLSLQLSYDIRNSKTGIGLMFSGKKWEKWATFLRGFFTENQDAESRFLKEAIDRSKQKLTIDPKSEQKHQSIFSSHYLFKAIIMAIGVSCALSFLIGTLFDCLKNAYKARKRKVLLTASHEMKDRKVSDGQSFEERFDRFSREIENAVLSSLKENISSLRNELKGPQERLA